MEMRMIIVDSCKERRYELWELLKLHNCFRLEEMMETTDEAMDYIRIHDPDVVFVHRQPADPCRTSQGTYLALMLEEEHSDAQVVVYSGDSADAYEAWRMRCAGFLLTPPDPLEVHQVVNRLRYIHELKKFREESTHSSLMVKTRSGYTLVKIRDILFIERVNRSSRIVTEDGQKTELVGYTMAQLEGMLNKRGFFRCHQSFLVNLSKVSVIHSDSDAKYHAIRFRGVDGEIAVSREKYTQIVSLLRDTYARDV